MTYPTDETVDELTRHAMGGSIAVYDETLGQYKALDVAEEGADQTKKWEWPTWGERVKNNTYGPVEVTKTTGEQRQDELFAISHAIDQARKLYEMADMLRTRVAVPGSVSKNRIEFHLAPEDHVFNSGTKGGEAIAAVAFNLGTELQSTTEHWAGNLLELADRALKQTKRGKD